MTGKTPAVKEQIRIRMYRVGFGDFFLLTLPGPHQIVVDCGVHARGDIGTIGKAVEDLVQMTDKKADIVIATHAHQDHISGFGTFAAQFSAFSVKEVWMPWTENPADPDAVKLKKKQMALVDSLSQHFAAQGGARYDAVRAVLLNLASNQAAFDLLRSGLHGAEIKYFESGQDLKNPAGIQGLTVKVLGPPRSPQFLAQMDPPAGQRYLRLVSGKVQESNVRKPFHSRWHARRGDKGPRLTEKEVKLLKDLAASSNEGLAFALDQVINNTSLVTLFQYRGQNLLFAGDAQYGNWKFWIEKEGSDQLLSQVSFYKVGHHGSVNATPKGALEKMATGKFAAMLSTQSTPWPSIPESKLIDALERQADHRVVRSDALQVQGAPNVTMPVLPQGFMKGNLWFDYVIPLG
ncbi:MAG TPA: MBL fold metallo-hydrolase [Acidobacteriota bacterium]|nr:MBL fold metallo-hydrolase [Acidobacteriota bacterium]